jgi:DNA-binding transcriptional ArsR family regulator
MSGINPVIHQPTRLRIMSSLVSIDKDVKVDFRFLQDTLSLSDGNLSIHLQKLEQAGFVILKKEFIKKRPKTWVELTKEGRLAFNEYVASLESIIKEKIKPISNLNEN